MMQANHPALSRFLDRLLLRSKLNEEEQAAILGLRGQACNYPTHHDIVGQGETVDQVCLVADGMAAQFDQMRDGRRQITAFFFVGEMCDLQSIPSPTAGWGITSLTPTTVLHIAHADLLDLAVRYPAIGMAFWRDTIVDASILAKWASNIGRKDARAGMAHLFCEFGVRMENLGLGERVCFRLLATQEQLGEALGVTPVHVNRSLKALRQDYISFENRTVRIHDWGAFTAVAEFDPTYLLLKRQG